MARKRYINNIGELTEAFRVVGGIFPHTLEDLNQTYKICDEHELEEIASKYSFDDIWEAEEPLKYYHEKNSDSAVIHMEINRSWGLAARGSHNISEEVMIQMNKNENSL
jgi:hypothetical protein